MKKPCFMIATANERSVTLQDVGPHDVFPTITNRPEPVVEQVAPMLNGRLLFYIDSDGNKDQLLVKDGKFAGFAPGGS